MNKRMWVMIICGIILLVLYSTGNLSDIVRNGLIGVIIAAFFLGSLEAEMRYGTGQLISPTVRGSVDLEAMLSKDDWRILPKGSIKSDSWQIYSRGGEGTVVFKITGTKDPILYKIGENALLLAEPKRVNELDLPGAVRDLIAGKRGYGPPYYIADKPLNPTPINVSPSWDVKTVLAEVEALRRERNIYKDAYHGKTGLIDKELGRITGAARSMEFSRWRRWFKREGEEERKPPYE